MVRFADPMRSETMKCEISRVRRWSGRLRMNGTAIDHGGGGTPPSRDIQLRPGGRLSSAALICWRWLLLLLVYGLGLALGWGAPAHGRRPSTDAELKFWLENMIVDHRFTRAETAAATGLTTNEIERALERLDVKS